MLRKTGLICIWISDVQISAFQCTMTCIFPFQEEISNEKCETISNLQQRLVESEKRLNKLIEETSRNAGLTGLTDKLKQDMRKLTSDLEKAHLDIQDRVGGHFCSSLLCPNPGRMPQPFKIFILLR